MNRNLSIRVRPEPTPGTGLGPLRLTRLRAPPTSATGRSAGVDHPPLRAGALYPPIAANLTILLVQTVAPGALLHTAQRLVPPASARAGVELPSRARSPSAFEKRGREYAVVEADVAAPGGDPLAVAGDVHPDRRTPPARHRCGGHAEAVGPTRGRAAPGRRRPPQPPPECRRPARYSRAGNFHSDPEEARRLGMPGLVAQGMQVCGPAYGVLLDAWGDGVPRRTGRSTRSSSAWSSTAQTVEAAVAHRRRPRPVRGPRRCRPAGGVRHRGPPGRFLTVEGRTRPGVRDP